MPESLAHYGFIPWLRQGVASRINEKDTLGVGSGVAIERAKVEVEVILKDRDIADDSENQSIIKRDVNLYGPGDIEGIQNRAILRTEPPRNVRNFEPNLLPYIEFFEEDFPWRYTPAKPADSGANSKKLRPWIVLVVLKKDEFKLNPSTEGLSSFTVTEEAINLVFGNHKDIWAWAHVHLNNQLNTTSGTTLVDEVNDELDTDPDSGISRIICPRKLNKSTAYHAFLIPAFETGRLAGLKEKTEGVAAQEPSWRTNGTSNSTKDIRKNTFPMYHQWEFATGELGDFESLVRVLKPVITKPESGSLPMDIQDPGFALRQVANTKTIGVEGALKPPAFTSAKFPNGVKDDKFVSDLMEILNLSTNLSDKNVNVSMINPFNQAPVVDDPIITPPTYGYWHSLIERLGESGNQAWVEELNLDPRWRGVAGLGTQTIQKLQEKLMHRAWQQVGDIKEANQKIIENETAKKISSSIFKKHLLNASGSQFTMLTQSTHNRLFAPDFGKTITAVFNESKVPNVAKSPAFRRIVRPGKKLNRQINKTIPNTKANIHQNLITNFNKEINNITAAKIKEMPDAAISFDDMTSAIGKLETTYTSNKYYVAKDIIFTVLNDKSLNNLNSVTPLLTAVNNYAVDNNDVNFINDVKNLAIEGIQNLTKTKYVKNPQGQISVEMTEDTFVKIFGSEGAISIKNLPTSKVYANVTISRKVNAEDEEWESKSTTFREIKQFSSGFTGLFAKTNQDKFVTVDKMIKPAIGSISSLYDIMKLRLQPNLTLDKKLRNRISFYKDNDKPMKPIMAHPKFDDAMYEEVSQISQDFILPNIESLIQDSVTILQTNQKFIESFLMGLNHEMARELLWREFPTDRMGTYFRQFWDVRDNIFEDDKEKTYDIERIHEWTGRLGNHAVNNPSGGYLVLVVRGQLMMKYPNTIVYAQKAEYDTTDATKERLLPNEITETNTKFPAFSARLEPDVYLFGFALGIDEARGERAKPNETTAGMNPGWYFVFKERPGQIKFGLDDYVDGLGIPGMPTQNAESWNDLSWEHLVTAQEELNAYQINFSKTISVTDAATNGQPIWGDNSADLAHILYQNPVIFARHAQEMLAED